MSQKIHWRGSPVSHCFCYSLTNKTKPTRRICFLSEISNLKDERLDFKSKISAGKQFHPKTSLAGTLGHSKSRSISSHLISVTFFCRM